MRLFIALPFDIRVQKEIKSFQKQMARIIPSKDIRWVKPGNIHLTIKFLGETSEDKIASISAVLEKTANEFQSFEIAFGTLKKFPSKGILRVLSLDFVDKNRNLINIKKYIEHNLEPLGFEMDRLGFRPHLTIGRLRANKTDFSFLNTKAPKIKSYCVQKIQLIKSELTNTGPRYEVLYSKNFI